MTVMKSKFGVFNGQEVSVFTLKNKGGMEVSCINYGCIITEIIVPDSDENMENVVLGFDNLDDYIEHSPYFGAICGRVAGRIGNAEFELNDRTYHLVKNNGENHLHGGTVGFDKVMWDAAEMETENGYAVQFSRMSPNGEEGYPGNLEMKVTYLLTESNEFIISYHGVSDMDTLVNVTNHTYFNLSGNVKRDILDHELQLKSSKFLELADDLIPTGEAIPVEGTPFDFRDGRKIREGTAPDYRQNVLVGNGYDHPFMLDVNHQEEIILKDSESGRMLIVETDEPSVVVYSGNMLPNNFEINGVTSRKHLGICLETQGPPDAIHHPQFVNLSLLREGEVYNRTTKYIFQKK